MNDSKFYWIKLQTDFFTQVEIEFLLSQKNGAQYVVLYQMLCLATANTDGAMMSVMNEMIVPYDIPKIVRDTKFFDEDTVMIALGLYQKLGLIYSVIENDKEIFKINDHSKYVGSIKLKSLQRQKQRENKRRLENDKRATMSDKSIEYRVKSIEYRNKSIESESKEEKNSSHNSTENEKALHCNNTETNCNTEIELEIDTERELKSKEKTNTPASVEDSKITQNLVSSVFNELKLKSNHSTFFNYYNARGWKFNNGNSIQPKALESLALSWEEREKKFNTSGISNTVSPEEVVIVSGSNKPDWLKKYEQEQMKMEAE